MRLVDATLVEEQIRKLAKELDTSDDFGIGKWGGLHSALWRVENALTIDAVEVVRCGECRFCDTADCPMSKTSGRVSVSDFCSYGEKKENR